jgi:hypothetical protein
MVAQGDRRQPSRGSQAHHFGGWIDSVGAGAMEM